MRNCIYDPVARRYNLLASLISMGLDTRLRNRMADEVCGDAALDIGTGTGKSALAIHRRSGASLIAAIDPSVKMLERATLKKPPEEGGKILFSRAAGENLPFRDRCFDCVATAFAIKHSSAPEKFISEARRVLKPGGKFIVLEARIPETALVKLPFIFYIKTVIPFVASFFGLGNEYRAFHEFTEKFPPDGDFLEMMRAGGFEKVRVEKLALGAASLYTGEKPAEARETLRGKSLNYPAV